MKRLAEWWFAPSPPERLAALRIAIGAFALVWLLVRMPELLALARLPPQQFAPVGLVGILDEPLSATLVIAIAVATALALAAFVAGIAYRIAAPIAALGLAWTFAYRSSWGVPFHTDSLLVMHVIALACSPAADAYALGKRRTPPNEAGYGWSIKLLAALTAATYLLAGIAKLRLGGTAWLDGSGLHDQIAFDNLRKIVLGGDAAPLAATALAHPAVVAVLAVTTLALELGAPLALLGGRVARMWAIGAWLFHVAIVLVMNIWFPYPLFGMALLPAWLIGRCGGSRLR
jgi:vitamin K-dependent gamma-carboxylase-like protein